MCVCLCVWGGGREATEVCVECLSACVQACICGFACPGVGDKSVGVTSVSNVQGCVYERGGSMHACVEG